MLIAAHECSKGVRGFLSQPRSLRLVLPKLGTERRELDCRELRPSELAWFFRQHIAGTGSPKFTRQTGTEPEM